MKIGIIFPKDSEALFDSNSSRTFGGASVQMFAIANELSLRKDHDIFCIIPKVRKLNLIGEIKSNLIQIFSDSQNILKTIFLFHKAIKKEKPDVLIQHGLTLFSCLLSLYCKIFQIKFVFMFASDVEVSGKYQSSQKRCYLFNILIKTANILVTQNMFQQNFLKKYKNIRNTLIYVGFPLLQYKNKQRKTILWIGRCEPEKQPEIFIDLAKRYPKYKFVMICPKVNQKYFDKIKLLAIKVDNLTFINFLSFVDTWNFFEEAKMFVNTSRFEGFPQTFVQSAVCGVPIISLAVNPDDFLSKYYCGVICYNNTDLLGKNVELILNDDALYLKYSRNILEYSKKNHNVKVNIDKLLNVLIS